MSAAVQKTSVSGLRSKVAPVGVGGADQVATGGVQDALRLPGAAGGVHDVERVLGRERLGGVLLRLLPDELVPPQVPAVGHLDGLPGPADDQHVADVGALGQGLVHGRLETRRRAPAVAAVGGDHHLDAAVEDARGQGVGGEAAEHDRVRGADPGAGQHGHHGLGDHRQVDRHPVAGLHPQLDQCVGRLLHVGGQLRVRDLAGVTRLALEVEGHPVAVAGLDVPVTRVVRRVQGAVGEPLRERRVAPVEHLGRLGSPGHPLGLLRPEPLRIGRRLLVRRRRHVGRRGEARRWREPAVLVRQVGQRLVGGLAIRGRLAIRRRLGILGRLGTHSGTSTSTVLGRGPAAPFAGLRDRGESGWR